MSDGPYGRHGFNANPGYGAAGGYAAPSYGQNYGGGASYAAPTPQDGGYGSQYGAYGGTESYQVGWCHGPSVAIGVLSLRSRSFPCALRIREFLDAVLLNVSFVLLGCGGFCE